MAFTLGGEFNIEPPDDNEFDDCQEILYQEKPEPITGQTSPDLLDSDVGHDSDVDIMEIEPNPDVPIIASYQTISEEDQIELGFKNIQPSGLLVDPDELDKDPPPPPPRIGKRRAQPVKNKKKKKSPEPQHSISSISPPRPTKTKKKSSPTETAPQVDKVASLQARQQSARRVGTKKKKSFTKPRPEPQERTSPPLPTEDWSTPTEKTPQVREVSPPQSRMPLSLRLGTKKKRMRSPTESRPASPPHAAPLSPPSPTEEDPASETEYLVEKGAFFTLLPPSEDNPPPKSLSQNRSIPALSLVLGSYYCKLCVDSNISLLVSPGELVRHFDSHHKGVYRCPACSETIITLESFRNHFHAHDSVVVNHSLYKFLTDIGLIHKSPRNYLSCLLCSTACISEAEIKTHIARCHPNFCRVCNVNFTAGEYDAHIQAHNEGSLDLFICTRCGYQHSIASSVKEHVIKHHPSIQKNTICKTVYKIQKIMEYGKFSCPYCLIPSITDVSYVKHFCAHSSIVCSMCNKFFVVEDETEEQSKVCPVCVEIQKYRENSEEEEEEDSASTKNTKISTSTSHPTGFNRETHTYSNLSKIPRNVSGGRPKLEKTKRKESLEDTISTPPKLSGLLQALSGIGTGVVLAKSSEVQRSKTMGAALVDGVKGASPEHKKRHLNRKKSVLHEHQESTENTPDSSPENQQLSPENDLENQEASLEMDEESFFLENREDLPQNQHPPGTSPSENNPTLSPKIPPRSSSPEIWTLPASPKSEQATQKSRSIPVINFNDNSILKQFLENLSGTKRDQSPSPEVIDIDSPSPQSPSKLDSEVTPETPHPRPTTNMGNNSKSNLERKRLAQQVDDLYQQTCKKAKTMKCVIDPKPGPTPKQPPPPPDALPESVYCLLCIARKIHIFDTVQDISAHFNSQHKALYKCNLCSNKEEDFYCKGILKFFAHVKITHFKFDFKEYIVDTMTKNSLIKSDIEIHFRCVYCTESTTDLSKLRNHVRYAHGYLCRTCGVIIKDSVSFFKHTQDHADSKITFYKCGRCFELFKSKILMKKHVKSHTTTGKVVFQILNPKNSYGSKKLSCPYCTVNIKSKLKMLMHVLQHSGGECVKCGASIVLESGEKAEMCLFCENGVVVGVEGSSDLEAGSKGGVSDLETTLKETSAGESSTEGGYATGGELEIDLKDVDSSS